MAIEVVWREGEPDIPEIVEVKRRIQFDMSGISRVEKCTQCGRLATVTKGIGRFDPWKKHFDYCEPVDKPADDDEDDD